MATMYCAGLLASSRPSPSIRLQDAQRAFDEAALLRNAGKYAEAIPKAEHSLALREANPGGSHLEVATSLNLLGELYWRQRNYTLAEPTLQRALTLREAALGPNHINLVQTLNNLANVYSDQRLYNQAEPLYQRTLAILEATFGKNHPNVAPALTNLAIRYSDQGLYDRAEPLYVRALAIREAALGKNHPDVADSLNNLANLYSDQGLNGKAEPLYVRALAIREAALGKNHPNVADSLNNLAILYEIQGLYSKAEPLHVRSLAIYEAALDKNHPDIALALNNLANLYRDQGLYSKAEPLYVRSLAIYEAALDKNHPDIVRPLDDLAHLYENQGLYSKAEPLYIRALAIREAAPGKNLLDVVAPLHHLASLYELQGLYSKAEPLWVRALAIREAALGKNHPDVAASLRNLADNYSEQRLCSKAEPLYVRSLAIYEAALDKNHPDIALALTNLANLYKDQKLYSKAEPLYVRALAIREAALGKNHPDVVASLRDLAGFYRDQGLYGKAEPLLQRALAIQEAVLGKNHPDLEYTLTTLGNLYRDQGLYASAEPLLKRALVIQETALGKNHPDLAYTLVSLADLYMGQKLYDQAAPLFQRAIAVQEADLGKNHPSVLSILLTLEGFAMFRTDQHHISDAILLYARIVSLCEQWLHQEALGLSEARLADFLERLAAFQENIYSLLYAHPNNPRLQRVALSAALLSKGRSVAEASNLSRTIFRSLGTEDRGSFEHLRALRAQLAQLSLKSPDSLSPADYQQRIKELTDQGDALEADLARRSTPLRALSTLPPTDEIAEHVAAALPKDGALVEFVSYVNLPPGMRTRQGAVRHYLALVLLPDARIRTVDLGPEIDIDTAAASLQVALENREADFQRHAQTLYKLAFRPLLPLLGGSRHVFLSPDGLLSLIPFDALHDGHRFLIDSFDFTYLTSGRDLLPRPQGIPTSSSVTVFADPAFSAPLALPTSSSEGESPLAQRSPSLTHFFSTLRSDLAEQPWPPLPGTRQEAEAIQRLIPQAQLFVGPKATKQRLLQLPTPGILHIATHGFFLENSSPPTDSRALGSFGVLSQSATVQPPADPLLRSGLVLTGASFPTPNTPEAASHRAESSLVTALELADLDLWGTQLVVLSACDTGRGEVRSGEGVYGLRRALVVAGAETVVMSLWKVNDNSTRLLMEAYYRNLLDGKGRATALRDAMLSLRQTYPHPHFWAPFIALGSDAPLRWLTPGAPPQPPR